MDAKQLAQIGADLFEKKLPLDNLHQEIAENFYPERADFTVSRSLGTDFAGNLTSSYPVLCRRDLGNQFSTMLRPTAKPWFHVQRKGAGKDEKDHEVREYFAWFADTMRKAMYDPPSLFTRATKEGDHDFSAFGQCGMSVEMNKARDGLLYRCWHLRDLAWQEDEEGQVGPVYRRWKPVVHVAHALFGDRLHDKMTKLCEKTPFEEVRLLHMVVPAEMFDKKARGAERWSIWWDEENSHVIEATPIKGRHYVIPRWATVSSARFGSQYALSPAVVAALPDARLIQAMTYTLLEAGEKAVNPPVVLTQDAVRSDVALYAGGHTWVDYEYDERAGASVRPIEQDYRGVGHGMQMVQDTRNMISEAFFLNKLRPFNPASDPQMTAFQAGQLVQEWIRNALPLFEPMEQEYNAQLCDETFGLMLRNGAFGSPADWPRELSRMEFQFRFESPLHDAIDQAKGQKWLEAKALIAEAVAIDQSAAVLIDTRTALRDALLGTGIPPKWMRSENEVDALMAQQVAQQQQAQLMAALEQGSAAAANIAGAQKDMAAAQMPV